MIFSILARCPTHLNNLHTIQCHKLQPFFFIYFFIFFLTLSAVMTRTHCAQSNILSWVDTGSYKLD